MAISKKIITCPLCREKVEIKISDNICISTYTCPKCKGIIKAKDGCFS